MGLVGTSKRAAKSEPARSMLDYLGGLGKAHMDIAASPGVQRVDPKLREAQTAMNPAQVLQQYNENQLFGTTAKGEPLRGVIQNRSMKGYATHTGTDLPDMGSLFLFPESKVPRELDAIHYLAPQMNFRKDIPSKDWAEHAYHLAKQLAGQSNPRAFDPRMFTIEALQVTPPAMPGSWTEGLRSRGKEMYGALYDMLRAGGHGNYADSLTPVNTVRRLGNVGSHAIGHGGFGYISPIDESIGYSTGLPGFKLKNNLYEKEYLESLFLTGLRPRNVDVVEGIRGINPKDLQNLTDEQKLGLLYLREAQLSSAYGPPTAGGQLTRLSEISPTDIGGLRSLAEPRVLAHPGNLPGAFGPSTLGRQVTTEAIIRRMMKGEEPEAISYQLLRDAPEGGFKGRYKHGGLASAFQG